MPVFWSLTARRKSICESDGTHPAFAARFTVDGEIPFPQVILRTSGKETLLNRDSIRARQVRPGEWEYVASVPSGTMIGSRISVQVEGCRQDDIRLARSEDWIKEYREVRLSIPSARGWKSV